ncbi:hypothetical protein CSAL01_10451 [Colletotrichum salicis]|uniref:Uncharacterized protein n=1 Tax=Colletotrichum salicis TaxID=1209931 RepID=A0A135V258_9PEZI|nr:hypothetical protein CSAL01_10451 [Colletotrichum salicis]
MTSARTPRHAVCGTAQPISRTRRHAELDAARPAPAPPDAWHSLYCEDGKFQGLDMVLAMISSKAKTCAMPFLLEACLGAQRVFPLVSCVLVQASVGENGEGIGCGTHRIDSPQELQDALILIMRTDSARKTSRRRLLSLSLGLA